MNALSLSLASIRSRPLEATLCIVAAATGIALLCVIFLLSQSIETGLMKNARGVDLIVGAKGSPLQLVLSSIYHIDVPNGNIEMADAQTIMNNPKVAKAIPLALGDNFMGARIVGTTPDYIHLYHGELATGAMFAAPFEAVAGSDANIKLGTEFAAHHGFAADSDDIHNAYLYKITGVLKPTGTVLDRMILTPVESVQQLHAHGDARDPDAAEESKLAHQVTALLIKVKNPISIMNLPRDINHDSNMLATSPAYVMARASQNLGLGRNILIILGTGFIALSALMLLSSLAASLAARRFDLGVLRVLGASPLKIAVTIITEALILGGAGATFGIIVGHIIAFIAAENSPALKSFVIPSSLLRPDNMDLGFLCTGLVAALLAAAIPAIAAGKTDIAALLARSRA